MGAPNQWGTKHKTRDEKAKNCALMMANANQQPKQSHGAFTSRQGKNLTSLDGLITVRDTPRR